MAQQEGIAGLVALIDRLEHLLERGALSELELEVEGTSIILRTPRAVAGGPALPTQDDESLAQPAAPDEPLLEHVSHAITAPLTGVFYRSPSPGAEPYVRESGPVSAGQVIGLIEAMKLFNEIKSDVTGTIVRIAAADGDLVKARQTLLEVEPS